jgi:uncharacterized membrane protein (UPF0127 family)
MPNLDEFLNKPVIDKVFVDGRVEDIQQMRPCSKCDLYVDTYQFNNQTMEMYWKCKDGHETRYSVG